MNIDINFKFHGPKNIYLYKLILKISKYLVSRLILLYFEQQETI
jgi:hypothetical protein